MDKRNIEIGNRIKKIRTELGMTQTELGDLLGLEKASISKYEAGDAKRGVPVGLLIKISEIGKKTVGWLITGESKNAYPTEAIGNHTVNESASIDLSLVKLIIESVEEHLQSNHLTMTPAKIAELVEVLYEEISESSDKQVNKGTVARLIKLAS